MFSQICLQFHLELWAFLNFFVELSLWINHPPSAFSEPCIVHSRYRKDLTQHEKTSHRGQTSCPFCKRDFDSPNLFEEHRRAKRFWGWGQFSCPSCDDDDKKKFCLAKDLKDHFATQGPNSTETVLVWVLASKMALDSILILRHV